MNEECMKTEFHCCSCGEKLVREGVPLCSHTKHSTESLVRLNYAKKGTLPPYSEFPFCIKCDSKIVLNNATDKIFESVCGNLDQIEVNPSGLFDNISDDKKEWYRNLRKEAVSDFPELADTPFELEIE